MRIRKAKLPEKVAAGKATMTGDPQVLVRLASTMDQWDPWFEMVPGTKAKFVATPKTDALVDDNPIVIEPLVKYEALIRDEPECLRS